MKTTEKTIMMIALLALVSCMIAPVCAEILTGQLGGITQGQTTWTHPATDAGSGVLGLHIKGIQYSTGTIGIIHENSASAAPTYASGAPAGVSVPMQVRTAAAGAGTVIVTGAIGYQRRFVGAVEIPGYQYLVFNDDWNITGLTGDKDYYLFYNTSAYYITNIQGSTTSPGSANGDMWLCGAPGTGTSQGSRGTAYRYYISSTLSEYTITKPLGLGISGIINKTVGGTAYNSQVFIYNGTSPYTQITGDLTSNSVDLPVNTNAQSISISMLSPVNVWYNTSILFAAAAPTVTPTPVPTIPPGYVRNTFVTIDGTTYATIHGSNIMLYDVEAAAWSNSTADADGSFYIDTLPYHTINAYATYTAYADHYGDASIMGAETGYSGMDFPIYMYPPGLSPGAGNINLYITVVDAATTYALGSARVQIELPTGAIDGTSTGSDGEAAIFVVPNNTTIKARVQKVGYGDAQESFNSGEVSPKTVTIRLSRGIVTAAPTLTPVPGGTVPTTIDPNDPGRNGGNTGPKAQEMMNFLANNGMQLIQLCFLVTILALLGVKLGGK